MSKDSPIPRRNFVRSAAIFASPVILPSRLWGAINVDSPNDRVNLGFIGTGKQGTGLLGGFLNTKGFHVVAVCEVDDNKRRRAKGAVEHHYAVTLGKGNYKGCDDYRDFRSIIKRTDIDAVVIATPDHWHAQQSIMAARAGKDIYCEKPLSLTIAEARQMVNAVRKYGRVFQTGSMQRSSQQFRQACELVRNGYIGEVKKVRVSIRTGFPPFPVDCDLPGLPTPAELDWNMWLGPAPMRPYHPIIAPPIHDDKWAQWRNFRDYSGGGMTDWGAHHFDIAQWGLGMDHSGPVRIIPPNGKDVPLLTYFYKNGVELTTDFENNRILFTGTEGWVDVNRSYIKAKPASLLSVKLRPDQINLYRSNDHKVDWLKAIRNRSLPVSDVEIGARSVTVCHLGNLAVELGRTLFWDPENEQFVNDPEANKLKTRARRSPWVI